MHVFSIVDRGYDPVAGNPLSRADSTVTITPCDDGSYCCGNGTIAQACCSNGNGYFIDANGEATEDNPFTASSMSSVSSEMSEAASSSVPLRSSVVASITVTATLEKTNTISPSTSRPAVQTLLGSSTSKASQPSIVASVTVTAIPKQANTGAIAGGVVGGIVGLALVGVGAFLLWRRGKWTKSGLSKGKSPNGIESYADTDNSSNGIQPYS